MSGAVEDARNAVGLGQQRGVGDREPDADAKPLDAADDRTRPGEYDATTAHRGPIYKISCDNHLTIILR